MPLAQDVNIGPLTLEPVWLLVDAFRLTREVSYGALALLLWDMCLTFADEVDSIWSARWSVINVLFLVNRYVAPAMIFLGIWNMTGLATHLSDNWCQTWLLINLAMELLCINLVTLALVLRLNSAWASRISWSFLAIWSGGVIASLLTWIFVMYIPRRGIYYEGMLNVCYVLIPDIWQLHVAIAAEHFIFLGFFIAKSVITPKTTDTAFLHVLLTDGIEYHTVTVGATIFSVLAWGFTDNAYNVIPLYTVWILCTIAMSRLLLNLQLHNMDSIKGEEVAIRLVDTRSTCRELSSSFTAVNSHLTIDPSTDIENGDGEKPLSHRRSNSGEEWSLPPNFPYLHRDRNRDEAGSVFTAPYASSALIPPSFRTARSREHRRPRKYKPRSTTAGNRLRVAPGGDTTDRYTSYDEGFTTGSGVTSGGEWSEVPTDSPERRRTSTLARNTTGTKRDITKPTLLTFDLSTKS